MQNQVHTYRGKKDGDPGAWTCLDGLTQFSDFYNVSFANALNAVNQKSATAPTAALKHPQGLCKEKRLKEKGTTAASTGCFFISLLKIWKILLYACPVPRLIP